MQLLYSLFAALCAFKCVLASLYVESDFPEVFYNEQTTPVQLTVAGDDLGSGVISSVRTSFYVPSKRGPKFSNNVSHSTFSIEGKSVTLSPIYAQAVKDFEVSYSVEVTYENGEKLWVDGEKKPVAVRDPAVHPVKLGAAVVLLTAILVGVFFLITRLSPPGYWESVLPKSLHELLPEKPKRA